MLSMQETGDRTLTAFFLLHGRGEGKYLEIFPFFLKRLTEAQVPRLFVSSHSVIDPDVYPL